MRVFGITLRVGAVDVQMVRLNSSYRNAVHACALCDVCDSQS